MGVRRALLLPAADINGGFGEDVMVAGFIKACEDPLTIMANIIEDRDYIPSNVGRLNFSKYKFKYLHALFLMREYSDFYIIGADILDGVYENNVIRFNLIKLAHNIKVKTHITGFSVREKSSEQFIKEMKTISKFTSILARDIITFDRLSSIVNNVRLTSDIAFLSERDSSYMVNKDVVSWIQSEKRKGQIIVAYCPNTIHAREMGIEKYVKDQKTLLSIFADNHCSILFLYHDLRKYALNMNDMDLSQMVYNSFSGKNTIFIQNIPDGVAIKEYISYSDFTLTGRMHFGISGYTLGLPMYGVSYYGKFEGVQMLFDIPTENSLIQYNFIDEIDENKIKDFIGNIKDYKQIIHDRLPYVRNLCLRNFE